ncbi:copine family protein 1-like [Mya arenaria]|uniref:copine family protein 1-like n=1 Tax=Mya arenaria TaxID=6604 RepID=UPI0022E44C09|nr:copine family protein 1-like [Mya arenaria]
MAGGTGVNTVKRRVALLESMCSMSDDYAEDDQKVKFEMIPDKFHSLKDVSDAIKNVGVKECSLIFGIDYTMSNQMQGKKTYDGLSLHDIQPSRSNPYQEVICILGETLEPFDDDGIIPAYGFGDRTVKDKSVFPIKKNGDCDGFMEVLKQYTDVTPTIKLGGPTNFAPIIRQAVDIVKEKRQYHILVIVADGQVTNEEETIKAIVEASEFPLSIVVIGVGDGPWDMMKDFDDNLPERKFDNFQFVGFHQAKQGVRNPDVAVALAALMEIPDQYMCIKKLRLMEKLL